MDGHNYGVPHRLTHEEAGIRLTAAVVDVPFKGSRVVARVRSFRKAGFAIDPAHRPKARLVRPGGPRLASCDGSGRSGPRQPASSRLS